jgi:hypothetical protein
MPEPFSDEWILEQLREERRQARKAAAMFVNACKTGDGDEVLRFVGIFGSAPDGWRLAMKQIARLPQVTPSVQFAFRRIWIEHKGLSERVGDHRVLAAASRVALPPSDYSGPPLLLYRGASAEERRRRLYGFSWTVDLTVAREFAERWATVRESVILQTLAPPEAIMWIRKPGDYEVRRLTPDGWIWEPAFVESERVVIRMAARRTQCGSAKASGMAWKWFSVSRATSQ